MNRKLAAALWPALMVVLSVASCSPEPQSSGTNTNWLKACTDNADCVGAGSCRCGICTTACTAVTDCAKGVCGSTLATAFQCSSSEPQRLCLPEPPGAQTCSEFPILADADLGSAPPLSCDVSGALLCESFDAPLPTDASTWYSGPMSAAVGNCVVHQGAGAVHYQANAFGYSQTRFRLAGSVSSGLIAARFYAYLPAQTVIPDYLGLFELWDQDTGASGKISVEAKPNDGFEVQVYPTGTTHPSAAGALLRDQWMCLVLTLDLAADNGSISLTVNGSPVIEQTAAVTTLPGPLSVAVVEALPSSDGTSIDLALDDLVVATQPLTCP